MGIANLSIFQFIVLIIQFVAAERYHAPYSRRCGDHADNHAEHQHRGHDSAQQDSVEKGEKLVELIADKIQGSQDKDIGYGSGNQSLEKCLPHKRTGNEALGSAHHAHGMYGETLGIHIEPDSVVDEDHGYEEQQKDRDCW